MKKFTTLILAFFVYTFVFAADGSFVARLANYLQMKNGIQQQDATQLQDLKAKAESPQLSKEERKKAYSELFAFMIKLQGSNPPATSVDRFVQTAVSWSCPDKRDITDADSLNPGELGQVSKVGTGKTPMILIPDIGFDGTVFEDFMKRNRDKYTMYAVTLPGFGGTPLPPKFSNRDYPATRLWKNAEQGILHLIEKEKLVKPVLVGHQAGAYLAVRTALDQTKQIGSVVVLNGLLYAPIPTSANASGNLTIEERAKMGKLFLPIELFPKPSPDCYYNFMVPFSSMLCKNEERGKALMKIASSSEPHIVWDHYAELMMTDLTNEMHKFTNPLLVIPSIPDDGIQKSPMNQAAVDQWKALKLSSMKIVPLENTRAYATEDSPEKLDAAIADFLN